MHCQYTIISQQLIIQIMCDQAPTSTYISNTKQKYPSGSDTQKEPRNTQIKRCLIFSLVVLMILGMIVLMISLLSARSPKIKASSKETSPDGSIVIYEVVSVKKNWIVKDQNSNFTVTAIKNPSNQRLLQSEAGQAQTTDIEPVVLTFTFPQEGITIRAGNIGSYIVEVDPDVLFNSYTHKNPEEAKRLLYEAEADFQLRRMQQDSPVEQASKLTTINTDTLTEEFDRSLLRTVAKSMDRDPDDLIITTTEVVDLVLNSEGIYDPLDAPQSSRLLHTLEKVRSLQQWEGIFDHINNAVLMQKLKEVEQTLQTFVINIDKVEDESQNGELKQLLRNSNFNPNSGQEIIIDNGEKEEKGERLLIESDESPKDTKKGNKKEKPKVEKNDTDIDNSVSNSTEEQEDINEEEEQSVPKKKTNKPNKPKGTTVDNNIVINVQLNQSQTQNPTQNPTTPESPSGQSVPVAPETQQPQTVPSQIPSKSVPVAPEIPSIPTPSISIPQFAPPNPAPQPSPIYDGISSDPQPSTSYPQTNRPVNQPRQTASEKTNPTPTKNQPEIKPADSQQSTPKTAPSNPADSTKKTETKPSTSQPKPEPNPPKESDTPSTKFKNGTLVVPSDKVKPALACTGSKQKKKCHTSVVNGSNSPIKVDKSKLNKTSSKDIKVIGVNPNKGTKPANPKPTGNGKGSSTDKKGLPPKTPTKSPSDSTFKPTQTTKNPSSGNGTPKPSSPPTPSETNKPSQPTKPDQPKPSAPQTNTRPNTQSQPKPAPTTPTKTPSQTKPAQPKPQPQTQQRPQTKPTQAPQPRPQQQQQQRPQPRPTPAPSRPQSTPQPRPPTVARPAPPPSPNYFRKK